MAVQQESCTVGSTSLRRIVVGTDLGPCSVRLLKAVQLQKGAEAHGKTADVYLHGAAGSWTTFQPLLSDAPFSDTRLSDAPLSDAPERDRVLVDLPGWGDSTEKARLESATVEAMAGAVVEVLDSLGYRAWNLVGHSMGGVIALHLAAAWPERTRSVAAISPTAFGVAHAVRHPWRGLATLPWFMGMLLLMRSTAVLGQLGTTLIRWVGNTPMMRLLLSPLFADPAAIPADVIRGLGRDARPRAFCAATRAVAQYDVAQWHGIRCPVLAIRGDSDAFTPPSDLDQLASLGPHIRTVTVPNSGHFAIVELPAAVQHLLDELRQR
ncbi:MULTISPECIES: alpha/beta hydrolase [unclassified Arthrobacter]|uniref:alpha/beta fold hydrolase n=1 Tax=unclassified Arthrobacter TaxID=235627 RepID=UPI002882DB59|nr:MULTISPECIES: alpha/beta hydrolase [unclassified Arthrobacter]